MRIAALAMTIRALRVDARSLQQAYARFALVGVLLLVLAFMVSMRLSYGAPGLWFASWLLHVDFWFITLLAVSRFSGVITEEKEAMTLGLLKLAGFDRISILLGKSVALLLTTILLLAVQLPFAVLAITMGGVSLHQVAAAFVILLSYLLMVYGLALLCSTCCRRSRAAAGLMTALLVAMLAGPGLCWVCARAWSGSAPGGWLGALLDELLELNPWTALSSLSLTGAASPFLDHVVVAQLVVAVTAVLAAWLLFERFNHEEWQPAPPRSLPVARRRGSGSRPPAGQGALAWKDFHFLAGGARAVRRRVVAYLAFVVLMLLLASPGPFSPPWISLPMTMMPWLLLLLALEYRSTSSRILHEEIKWQTLPALATLPIATRTWLRAKARGNLPRLLPITLCTLLDVLGVLQAMSGTSYSWTSELWLGALYFCAILAFAVHAAAWLSLSLRRGALAATIGLLVVCHLMSILAFSTCAVGAGGFAGGIALVSLGYIAVALALWTAIPGKLKQLAGR